MDLASEHTQSARGRAVSIVSPVYNEEDNIVKFIDWVTESMASSQLDYELILVDDGSADNSLELAKQKATNNPRIKIVAFDRNYGQTAAMAAGFRNVTMPLVVAMDSDLQNDPSDIPLLINKIDEGFDAVSGWRKNRKDKTITRIIPSYLANSLISSITGVRLHDYGCTLKIYKKQHIDKINLYGEMHRFIPAYIVWAGGKVAEVVVNHHPRIHGTTKYGISRTFRVVLDLVTVKFLTKYLTRPMHFFGTVGLCFLLLSGLFAVAAFYFKFGLGISFILTPLPMMVVFSFMLGVQFILLGLLAEINIRTYFESQRKEVYTIREKINF